MEKLTTFEELKYERPDFDGAEAFYADAEKRLNNAESFEETDEIIKEEEKIIGHLNTMATIASIRRSVDMSDEFYEKEEEYIDRRAPETSAKARSFYLALINSAFAKEIDKKYGENYLKTIRLSVDSLSEKNVPLMQKENELCNEYRKIIASCRIDFNGEQCNLQALEKYFSSPDRKLRKSAWKAYSAFFEENDEKMVEIFGELIRVRTEMGKNLGFENFVPLGYMQQGRLDYDEKMVAEYRAQVKEVLVPFCEKLYKAQAKRIGVEKIMAYDEAYLFDGGNAVPVGDRAYLVEQAREMYHDMSAETGEFIDYMIDHDLMDLDNKPNKMATGFMTSLDDYKAPFVFSCFNGTTGDVDVLTHEMGHAFAGYEAMRAQPLNALASEPTDIAEIHSMSMEQFAYPYAEKFFGDKADKYRMQHLQEAFTFVPFGVAVDEFQHIVYKNPDMTAEERTAAWKSLEEKYMPWRDYDGDEFFGKGGWWYHKIHIFLYPFYYVNYTLTTLGALEFKKKMHEDKESAWKDYLTLCRVGGSLGYLKTLAAAHLCVPFEKGSVKKAASYAMGVLEEQLGIENE